MVKTCSKCRTKNPDDAFWCINCNTKLVENLSIVQKESQSIEDTEWYQDVQLRDYVSSSKPKESRIRMDISIFKIPLIIFFIVAIIWTSIFFYSNIHIDEFNWEHYNFPWDNDNLPWDNNNFPWISDLSLDSITNYQGGSQEFIDVGQFNEDYWFDGDTIYTKSGWVFTISKVVDCSFEGIVLDTHVYNKDDVVYYPTETFSPIDIFFGYDDVVTHPEDYPYRILGRFYRGVLWECTGSAYEQNYFRLHTSNTHIIPHNAEVFNVLSLINVRDIVTITGSYVNVYGTHPSENTQYSWETDTVIGNWHCEIILVNTIGINGNQYGIE